MRDATTYAPATLNYSSDTEEATPVRVNIRDGRAALCHLDFETCGFTLLNHKSNVTDWSDEATAGVIHCPEMVQLAREFTGCTKALAYQPLIRSPAMAKKSKDHAPIDFVHTDYTHDFLPMIREDGRAYRNFLDPLLAEAGMSNETLRGASRVMMLQLWRNLGAEAPDYPFAVCDASTMPRSQIREFLVHEYDGFHLEFEIFIASPPRDPDDNHWYTFPRLTKDEVIAFRTYDSKCAEEGRPFWTLHSAFRDETVGASAPQRESVEMRVMCIWEG